jgi:glycine/D-amino acid oxidase-like deaminating enzyme
MRARAVVVGGGAIGASCFYHLVERGVRDVVLLEQATLGSGSTGRSAAVVETQYLSPEMVALCAFSIRLFRRLERERGLPFEHHGYLRLGHTAADLAAFARSLELQRAHGLTDAVVLDRADLARRFPALLADDVAGALWGPTDGYVDAVRYCEALVELGRAGGGQAFQVRRVVGVEVSGGRVTGVRHDAGAIECDVVVNAAGAWARRVGAMVGATVPVDGYRRQLVIFEPEAPFAEPVPMTIDYVPGVEREGLYFRDDTPSRLVAGLHWEGSGDWERPEDPDRFPQHAEWDYGVRVAELLATRLRDAGRLRRVGGWSGLYPLTPDTRPIVSELPGVRGFYHAVGGGGVGVQTSPALGAIVADLVTRGRSDVVPDVASLALERFTPAGAAGAGAAR